MFPVYLCSSLIPFCIAISYQPNFIDHELDFTVKPNKTFVHKYLNGLAWQGDFCLGT